MYIKLNNVVSIKTFYLLLILLSTSTLLAQNSMVGDGFGGRLWYKPSNYTVGSYSAYTICGDSCGANNQLYGWGHNQLGQLGTGDNFESTTPRPVIGMTNVRYYSTGYCMGAIKNDNTAWVWGRGAVGGNTGFTNIPQQVLTDVKFMDAGMSVCTFVKNDGTVWSVGSNIFGSFGNGSIDVTPSIIPVQMKNITNAVRVANGRYTNVILLADGRVMAVGDNFYGGLGNIFLNINTYVPVFVNGLSNIIDIKSHQYASIALDSAGEVYIWGTMGGNFDYIGNGTASNFSYIPTKLPSLKDIVAISGCNDGYHFLALDKNHNCYAWGNNNFGQLGSYSRPIIPVLVDTNVVDIMAGETFSYIVKTDGSLWATGSSLSAGSIWMNLTNTQRNVFTQINPLIAPMNLCKPIAQYTAFAQPTDATCTNSGTITVTHSGGKAPFTYSIGNGFQSSNVFTNVSAGNYTVNVKDSAGCISSVLTTVSSSTNAITNLSKSITHATCGKNNGAINVGVVTGGVAPFQYNFNNAGFSSNKNYTNLSAGNYSIVVKDSNGCNYNTNAIVSNIGTPTSTTITDTICDGRVYNFNGKNITTTGTYTDTLVNASNCDSIISLSLFVTPIPASIHLGRDTTLCEGDTLRLDASTANASYVWQDSSTLPYFIVTKDGIYHVAVTANCFNGSDTIQVTYKSCEETTCTYFIPTAFTPNDDGKNDEFKIRSNCELSGVLIIYNRYGNEVFKTTDLSTGWNGKYKNETVQQDVYAYYTEFTFNGKTEKRKGNITLLK
jgi:gliding motility-associated-like protein